MNNINRSLFVFFVSDLNILNMDPSLVSHWQWLNFSAYSFRWVPDQEIFSALHYQNRIHTDAWCISCSQSCKRSFWSGLCMSSPSPLHWPATQNFDEHYKCKQSELFLNQPEHSIWVSRHRTLRTQYLHFSVFLWKQYTILVSYKDFCKLQSFCLSTPLFTLT